MEQCKQKRERSSNFSPQEKDMLLDIVLGQHKDIILCKKIDKATTAKKEKAWREVAAHFNSQNYGADRNWKSLKMCFDNIKRRTKRALANEKVEMHKTGDDNFISESAQKQIADLKSQIADLKSQFIPISNPCDDDANFHPEVIYSDINNSEVCSSPTTTSDEEMTVMSNENISLSNDNEKEENVELADLQHTSQDSVVSDSFSEKKATGNVPGVKYDYYKRRLECLECEHKTKVQCLLAEHEIRMETLKIEREIKELQLKEIKKEQTDNL